LTWRVEYDADALKVMRRLDHTARRRIADYLTDTAASGNPRSRGKGLVGNLAGLWAYRVGSWRIVCDLMDGRLVIYAIDVAHRSNAYRTL
jgi:mRNA interferase RelE/StbE